MARTRKRATVDRTPATVTTRVDLGDEVVCPGCDEILDRHQPDSEWPERILGICPECHAWFAIDETRGFLTRLPDVWSGLPDAR